ncbi:MAG TPA: clostripain-related cysteine peptidase [Herpetosiphonaceae bacterium]
MPYSMLRVMMLFLIIGSTTPSIRQHAPDTHAAHAAASAVAPTVDPLPGGCGRVTPGGDPEAACCISGYVFMDGDVVAGAEVQIESPRGDKVTVFTQVYSGTSTLPFYQISLSAPPLNIAPGETITVRTHYSSHQQNISYVVQPGGQQLDLVVPRRQSDDYVVERQIWGQAEPQNFNGATDVAVDSSGNVYVLDNDNARVQVFNPAGQLLRRWGSLGNLPGQLSDPRGLTIDRHDNVYIADTYNARIQKFSSGGTWLATWGSPGHANGQFDSPRDVVVDRSGNIYVADTYNYRIQKLDSAGRWLATWNDPQPADGQQWTPRSLAIDSAGHVYAAFSSQDRIQKLGAAGELLTEWGRRGNANGQFWYPRGIAVDGSDNVYVADSNHDRIQKFTSAGAWLATWGTPGQANGQVSNPRGIAVDGSGNVYVADTNNARIQKFTSAGVWLRAWGSLGRANGQLWDPRGIAVDGNHNVYIVDTSSDRVQKFSSAGDWLAAWGTPGQGSGQFQTPNGIAVDSSGNVYVADSGNHRIQKFTSAGAWLAAWGSLGSNNGQLRDPKGVAADSASNVYVADSSNHRIQKFSSSGTWLTAWGSFGSGKGQFKAPEGIAVDGSDNVYIVDSSNHRIQKFSSSGTWIATWATPGSNNGQLWQPRGIAADGSGNVYVADTGTHRIQKFSSSGAWLAAWGVFGSAHGEFSYPTGVAVDGAGVYVTDTSNNRAQLFRSMAATRPVATITHLSSASLSPQDTLVAHGLGQDNDATPSITGYRWTSDKDGVLGTSAALSLAASSLTSGTHRLSLEVQDQEGEWSAPATTSIYVATTSQAQWTMLLYLAGDYHDRGSLLSTFTQTLETLKRSFRNPYVRIAVQIDGPADGDTRRLLFIPGTATSAPQVTDLAYGERAMDDPAVLADFIRWGQSSFPSTHYYLAIADHGQAIQGIAWDTTSDLQNGTLNDDAFLTSRELGQALSAPNVAPIDILHLDACAMNLLEVTYEVRHTAQMVIASQYLGWGYFAYDDYQSVMGANTTAYDVAQRITAKYAARAAADGYPHTIAALDMRRAEPMLSAVDALGAELAAFVNNQPSNRELLHGIWQQSQKFESNGDYVINDLDMYVDVVDWAGRIQRGVNSPAVQTRAATLAVELTGPQPFIIAGSNHARSDTLPPQYANGAYIDVAGARGVSIFYPQRQNTQVFDSYINNRMFSFTSASRWPDFLVAGVGALPPGPLEPPPPPLSPLEQPHQVFLPAVQP